MSRRRDLGSMFDEDGPGESPAPSEPATRPAAVDEPLLNDEARQMLEERTRAAKEAAGRAAGVAAEKGKEFGKAALGAFGKWKEERKRRSEEAAAAKSDRATKLAEPTKPQTKAPLEDPPPEEVAGELEGNPRQSGFDETFPASMDASLVYDGMGRRPAEVDALDHVDDTEDLPATDPDWRVEKVVKPNKPWLLIAAGIGGAVLLVATLAHYFMRPTPAPVVEPTTSIEVPAPVEAPAPVAVHARVPVAPVQEMTVATQPAIEIQELTPEVAPAPVVAAPEPTPIAKTARKATPAPLAPRAKLVERAPPPAPEPQKEQQQIEQIHDFAKQLESMGGG